MIFINPQCPPQQRVLKATSPANGDRMSLLSRHLASPAQASNFLWLSAGLPSMWESGVDNEPHLWGSWVPEAPLLQAFEESIHVLPGVLPLWPAPLFSISSGESIDMQKGGSKLMSYSEMCWKILAWRRLLQKRMSWTQILFKCIQNALISLPSLQNRLVVEEPSDLRVKHSGVWIQVLLSHSDPEPQGSWRTYRKVYRGLWVRFPL